MNRAAPLALFAALALPLISATTHADPQVSPFPARAQAEATVKAGLLSAPLQFEENRGQAPERFDFISRGRGSLVFLRADEARISVAYKKGSTATVTLALKEASDKAKGKAEEMLPGVVNYIHGNDAKKWIQQVPTSGRVKYEGVYPGIDVAYYGTRQRMEYDFILAPHANPHRICWEAQGADSVKVDEDGNLVMTANGVPVEVMKPVAYQMVGGEKKAVKARFSISGKEIRFALNSYDKNKALVIDPVVQMVYSTFIGGSYADQASAVTADNVGNLFVTGWTQSYDFPATTGSTHANDNYNQDAFVTMFVRLSITGSTSAKGSIGAHISALSLSGTGITISGSNLFISGTSVGSGPVVLSGSGILVSGSGVAITGSGYTVATSAQYGIGFSTFIGGSQSDEGTAIAVSAGGSPFLSATAIYVAGNSTSEDLPVAFQAGHTPLPQQKTVPSPGADLMNGFVAKLNTQTGQLVYLNYIGYPGQTSESGISVSPSGNVVISGQTTARLFNALPFASGSSGFKFILTEYTVSSTGVPTPTTDATGLLAMESDDRATAFEIAGNLNGLAFASQGGGSFTCGTTATPHQYNLTYILPFSLSFDGSTAQPYTLPPPPEISGTDFHYEFCLGEMPVISETNQSVVSSTSVSLSGTSYTTLVTGTMTVYYSAALPFDFTMAAGYYVRLDSFGVMQPAQSYIFGEGIEDSANAVACDWTHNAVYVGGCTVPGDNNPNLTGVPYILENGWATILQPVGAWGAVNAVALDQFDNCYAAGYTNSTVFPTFSPFQTYPQTLDTVPPNDGSGSETNGFIAKFDPTGRIPIFSTYFGGSQYDIINGIAVDSLGNIYVTGQTASIAGENNGDFPILGSAVGQNMNHNYGTSFLSVLVPQGNALHYSTLLGGSQISEGWGVAVTPGLNPTAYVVGATTSPDFPTTPGALMTTYPNQFMATTGFVTTFQEQSVNLWLESITPSVQIPVPGQPMTYTVTVKNISSVDAMNAVVYQTLSASEVFVSAQGSNITNYTPGSLSTTTDTVVAQLGVVLAGGEVSYQITVKPTGPQVIQTTATVQSENDGLIDPLHPTSFTLQQVAMPVVSLAVTRAQASEDGTPGIFTVSRVGDLSQALNILYTVSGSNTLNGVDYAWLSGTAIMPAGAASVDIDVNPYPILDTAASKSVSIQVTQGANYILGTALSGTVGIGEIPLNFVNLVATVGTASKSGQNATLTLTRTGFIGNALPVTLQVSGNGGAPVSATAGLDYSITGVDSPTLLLTGSFTVTIPANTTSANIVITPIPDFVSGQPAQQTTGFNVSVQDLPASTVSGAASTPGSGYVLGSSTTAAVTILDPVKDSVSVMADNPIASASGTNGSFQIVRTGDTANDAANSLTVQYTTSGSAINGTDYQKLSGVAVIPAGASSVEVPVDPILSTSGTAPKAAVLTLAPVSPSSSYTLSSTTTATVTIYPFAGSVVTVTTLNPLASLTGTNGLFQISRAGGDTTVSLPVSYSMGGSASPGVDYQSLSGVAIIPAYSTAITVAVTPIANSLATVSSTATLTVGAGTGYLVGTPASASVKVSNLGVSTQPVVTLSVITNTATQTSGELVFQVTRTGDLSQAILVNYSTAGNAVAGVDYENLTGSIALPPNVASENIVVQPLWNPNANGTEVVYLQLGGGTGYALGANTAASGAIYEVPQTVVSANAAIPLATETGTVGVFTLTRTGTAVSQPLYVSVQMGGSAINGVDYALIPSVITIPAGSNTVDVNVTPLGTVVAPSTTVTLTVVGSTSYNINTGAPTAVYTINPLRSSASVSIARFTGPAVTVEATRPTANTGTSGVFRFTRTGPFNAKLVVKYTVAGTGSNGSSYAKLPGVVTIPAGAAAVSIAVTPAKIATTSAAQSVILSLAPAPTYKIGAAQSAVVTIAAPPPVTVTITANPSASSVYEGFGPVGFVFTRAGGSNSQPLTIPFALGGTAKAGVNYTAPATNTITIPANKNVAVLTINTIDDHIADPPLTVILTGAGGPTYQLASPGRASVTILDADLQSPSL